MLKRKLYGKMLAWRHSKQKKALFITGARQVGKSFLIRTLAENEYECYLELNLFENTVARRALSEARDAKDFISRVTILSEKRLVPGKSLIFIDEVQELPDVMTWAKFLIDDGRFDWAFSGSMLGTEFKGIRSYPVGPVFELTMHPLDFEEFSWAIGVSEEALFKIRTACKEARKIDDYIHDAMLANYRTYLVVGGMPEVVQRFIDSQGDLAVVRELQNDLNVQYRRDISKYAGSRSLCVQNIFDQLPVQLEGDSQRFALNSIDSDARFRKYQRDFLWLVNANVALKTNLVTEPVSPLARTAQISKFKLYQSDVGMLTARFPLSRAQAVYFNNKHTNLDGIYENSVAQEFAAQGLSLYYHMTKKRGEVDFVLDGPAGSAIPIEVKSGTYYHAHAALDHILGVTGYRIERAYVLSMGNIETNGKILYLPVYSAFCMSELLNRDNGDDFRLQVRSL